MDWAVARRSICSPNCRPPSAPFGRQYLMQPLASLSIRSPGYPSVVAQRAIRVEPDGLQLRLNLFFGLLIMIPASLGHRSAGVHLYFPPTVGYLSAVWLSLGEYVWLASHLSGSPGRRRIRYHFSRSFRILGVSNKKISVQATWSWARKGYLVAFDFAPTTCLTAINHTFSGNVWISWRRGRPWRFSGARRVGGPHHRLHIRRALTIYPSLFIDSVQ